MKQRLPGILCLLATVIISITAARQDRSDTASFVRQNQTELTALAEEVLTAGFGREFSYPGVDSVRYAVYMEDGTFVRPFVEFTMDSLAGYSGFYYSPTDIPIPFQGASDARLRKTSTGWAWEHLGNRGTTAKITEFWYTYEAHF